jgi:short-subunit dehydrogenase
MQLNGKHVVLTGGQGGIGSLLAARLKAQGAKLTIIDRQEGEDTFVSDLSDMNSLNQTCEHLAQGDVDVLINLAGVMYFGHMQDQRPDHLAVMMRVNLEVPIRLSQAVLPGMLKRGSGQIVNIGSVFGALSFPHFSVYSATKAGLKGFSEAIRREYIGSGIGVTYIAPRAVKTPLNSGPIAELHTKTKTVNDPPEKVANMIVQAILQDRKNVIIGFPESLFVKINALCPAIIDNALVSKRDIANEILQKTR